MAEETISTKVVKIFIAWLKYKKYMFIALII